MPGLKRSRVTIGGPKSGSEIEQLQCGLIISLLKHHIFKLEIRVNDVMIVQDFHKVCELFDQIHLLFQSEITILQQILVQGLVTKFQN